MNISKPNAAATILERSVCLTLSCHYLGNHRKVSIDQLVNAVGGDALADDKPLGGLDEKQLKATKRLIDTKELNPVLRVQGRAKGFLRSQAIAAHRVFGDRSYLIPLSRVEFVDAQLQEFAKELRREATKLSVRYRTAMTAQESKIGSLFNAKDYIEPHAVIEAFSIEWDYVSFAAPEKLETVSRALFEGVRAKYENKMADAYEEVRQVLRETLRQIVGDIVEKLQPDADGTPKVFRNSILTGLTDYLETFSFRNLTDDAELASVVKQLKKITNGVTPDTIRKQESVRDFATKRLSEVAGSLDKLVGTGRRAISFGDLAQAM